MFYNFISTKVTIVLTEYLDGEVSGSSQGHTNNFKNGLTASQPLLAIISLTRKRHTLYNGPPDKGGIIQGAG